MFVRELGAGRMSCEGLERMTGGVIQAGPCDRRQRFQGWRLEAAEEARKLVIRANQSFGNWHEKTVAS